MTVTTRTWDVVSKPTMTVPLTKHLLMGWRHTVRADHDQLTHAVLPGSHTAQCGIVISVVGDPWPEPGAGTPLSRCSICAQAVQGMWKDAGTWPGAR